mgnify:CR=1 FL=1
MHIEDILLSMGKGEIQSDEAVQAFVSGVVSETISRPQAAAWLAFAFARTLSDAETLALTRAMTDSGDVMTWPDGPTLMDKHSTGGVGDKVSLVLAPLWVALGRRVPMISGRGLGHTGGTLDKLEAIPGYRTDLDQDALERTLQDVGCFISGQTRALAPADRILYALRNETQTVASIPLITGSILSKKLAEGVEHLVLDVKVGSGAFMTSPERGAALARMLVRVCALAGKQVEAHLTAMDQPLGQAVGNANEVEEAVACLRGGGPADLRALTLALAGDPRAADLLDNGAAMEIFERMVHAQGGDVGALDGGLRGAGCQEHVVVAERDGFIGQVHALSVGRAAFVLGAGRSRAEDPVDHGVGLQIHARVGQKVDRGQPLVTVLHRDGHALDEALALLRAGVTVTDEPGTAFPLLMDHVGPADV